MNEELTCENYEITIGEGGEGVVLTFDLDDVCQAASQPQPGYVKSLEIDDKGFHVALSIDAVGPPIACVLFPMHEGMPAIVEEIRTSYGRLFVAALGEGKQPGSSAVAFAREMLLG